MLADRLGFYLIKDPVLSGIGATLAQDLLADISHVLKVVLVLQNGALIGSLLVGMFVPQWGDILFLLLYAAITVYGVHSIYGQKRFLAYVLETRSIRQAMGREILSQVHDRAGFVGVVLGGLLFDIPKLASEIGDYVWEGTRSMVIAASLLLALNLLLVRLMLIPELHHWLMR